MEGAAGGGRGIRGMERVRRDVREIEHGDKEKERRKDEERGEV